jgi:hypothetical protein
MASWLEYTDMMKFLRMCRQAGTTEALPLGLIGGSVSGSVSKTSVMYGILSQLFHGPAENQRSVRKIQASSRAQK